MATRIRNRKPYHQWIIDHKEEILALPNKERTDYVMNKLKTKLNLDMKRYNVYQLLYRNGLIKHKDEVIVFDTTTKPKSSDELTYEEVVSASEPDTSLSASDAISGGPVDEQYLHQRIYEMFGIYCPIEEDDPFGYGE